MNALNWQTIGVRRARLSKFRTLLGVGLPLMSVIGWGGLFPVAKATLPAINAFYLSSERYVLASLIFVAALWMVEGRQVVRFDGHFRRVTALGSAGFAGYNLFVFVGLAHTRPQNAALLMAAMPLLTVLVLWLHRGFRPSTATVAFMSTALAGVVLVVSRGSLSAVTANQGSAGDLMVLIGALFWVIYTLGASSLSDWSPLRYTALTAMMGTATIIITTIVATILGIVAAPSLQQTKSSGWEMAYMVVPGTAVAVLAWNAGIKRLGPQNTVLFINLVPIITLAIEVPRGYHLVAIELLGVSLTLAAVTGNNLWQRYAAGRAHQQTTGEMRAAA